MKKPPTNCDLELEMIIELFEPQIATEKIFTIYLDCILRFKADLKKIYSVVTWMRDEDIIKDFKFYSEDDYSGTDEQMYDLPFHLFEIEFDSKENVLRALQLGVAKMKLIQRVFFERTTGSVIVDGDAAVVVQPNSAQFFMLDLLETNFNEPIEYKRIYEYCVEKMGKEFQADMSTFVSDKKSDIKERAITPALITKILLNTRTHEGKAGIRLTNP